MTSESSPVHAFLDYTIAVVMTLVALWRLPAVLYADAHRRALWGCYAGFAAALWLSTRAVMNALRRIPVVDLDVLLKHYVSIAAILAILTYVAAMYGRHTGPVVPRHVAVSGWIARVAYRYAFGAVALLTLLFFTVVHRARPSQDFVADHTGEWGAAAYLTVFYVYLIAASAVCGYQWTGAFRRAETALLRTGLLMMSIAMWIGVLYTAVRIALIWLAVADALSRSAEQRIVTVTAYMVVVLFLLFAAGVSIPVVAAIRTRWQAWRALRRLYPLWRDLMTAFPGTSFTPTASRLREMTRFSLPVDIRLDRWVADIADAVDALRHFAPPALFLAAEDAAEEHPDPQPAAEAYWIKAALQAVAGNARRAAPSAPLPAKPFVDSDAHLSWLLRVQSAYEHVTTAQAQQLLAQTAQEPAT